MELVCGTCIPLAVPLGLTPVHKDIRLGRVSVQVDVEADAAFLLETFDTPLEVENCRVQRWRRVDVSVRGWGLARIRDRGLGSGLRGSGLGFRDAGLGMRV